MHVPQTQTLGFGVAFAAVPIVPKKNIKSDISLTIGPTFHIYRASASMLRPEQELAVQSIQPQRFGSLLNLAQLSLVLYTLYHGTLLTSLSRNCTLSWSLLERTDGMSGAICIGTCESRTSFDYLVLLPRSR